MTRTETVEAMDRVRAAWGHINDRVNQAADDGYDVVEPDVLADALWTVSARQAELAKGTPFLARCAAYVAACDAEIADIDQRFPRGSRL